MMSVSVPMPKRPGVAFVDRPRAHQDVDDPFDHQRIIAER